MADNKKYMKNLICVLLVMAAAFAFSPPIHFKASF